MESLLMQFVDYAKYSPCVTPHTSLNLKKTMPLSSETFQTRKKHFNNLEKHILNHSKSQEISKNLNYPAGIPYTNQLITYEIIKLVNSDKPDPQPALTEHFLNQNYPKQISGTNKYYKPPVSGGTPNKEPPLPPHKKTPIKVQEEEIIEETNLVIENTDEEEYKEKALQENSGVFQPMGKAAGVGVNKKNPWSSQNSKKSLVSKPHTVPKNREELQINANKVNKRLDLDSLKKKGNHKNQSLDKNSKGMQKSPEKEKSPDNKEQEDYYEKSSKFNTVTDPRIFAPENLALNKWSNEELSDKGENIEIEENIKEIESMRASKKLIKDPKSSYFKSPAKRDTGTNFQSNKVEISQEIVTVGEATTEEMKNNESPTFKETSKGGFYEQELNKMIKEDIRPYSPPFNSQNVEVKKLEENGTSTQKNMLEVVYDPVLNCYYDPKTNSYYDLIN